MLIKELIKNVNDSSTLKSWIPIMDSYLSKLDECDYECLCDELYETIYGEVLSEEKAKKLVHEMKPYGEHWNIEQVSNLISNGYKRATNYYAMNMMFNDYQEVFKDDTNKYIEMVSCWLNDEDSCGGDCKTYRYATRV